MRIVAALAASLVALAAGAASAGPVGQQSPTTTDATAGLRDAHGRPTLRMTIWYPAASGAATRQVEIGPPGAPLFTDGQVAPNAPWADGPPHPLIVVSHGFGGSALQMAWLGTALAQRGYVVLAMDHPGGNGVDPITAAAVTLPWQRADDVKAALDWALSEPEVQLHVDPHRVGFVGYSLGGYTGLVVAGARSDVDGFLKFCASTPQDPICRAPAEAPEATPANRIAYARTRPELAAALAGASHDRADPRVRAVFVIAPAPVQLLDPASLKTIRVPVEILLGSQDGVAPPATNGRVAAVDIPGARLDVLAGVGHYDFLDDCTAAGRAKLHELCGAVSAPQDLTHRQAVAAAAAFFDRTLRPAAAAR